MKTQGIGFFGWKILLRTKYLREKYEEILWENILKNGKQNNNENQIVIYR